MNKQFNDASFFIELGKPLAKARTVKDTLNIVMYQVGKIFEPVNWSLLLKDSKTNEMVFAVVVGSQKKQLQGMRLPMGRGIVGHIMESGQSVIIEDVAGDERFCAQIDQSTGFKTSSIIGVPLKTDEKIFGVIELVNKISGENFTSLELTVLEAIAEYAAIAIERSYYLHSLKNLALMDSLTGLKNRLSFEKAVKNSSFALQRYGIRCGILLVDVVDFKQINETSGFQAGNDVLRTLAEMLRQALRGVDDIFHYGGDKFIVILPHAGKEEAEQLRQRMLNQLANAQSSDRKIAFQVSVVAHTYETDHLATLIDSVEKRFLKRPSTEENAGGGMEMHIHSCLNTESLQLDQEQELKVGFRKKVSLMGDFKHFNRKIFGRITVHDVSMQGISFETRKPEGFEVGDLLDVNFTLDDRNRSRIKRRVSVRIVDGKSITGDYYNPPPHDKHLGFYLMG
ncbi:sensor domain-containing diguanylate cyclase [Desulfocicer niacini]